jgi:hypothetical protein
MSDPLRLRGAGKPPKFRKPTKEQAEEKWKSTNPRDLAYEIATFMGGEWPERPVRKVQLSLEGAPMECEDLMDATGLNPTLLSEMTVPTRELFLEVYFDDIQDVYSEVMESLTADGRVTFKSLRKFKHLTISLGFKAVSDVCQAAFDHPETDFDEFPEVSPDNRPGCWCKLDVGKFTELTAATTALVKMLLDEKGELPPAAEARIIRVEKSEPEPEPAPPSLASRNAPPPTPSLFATD